LSHSADAELVATPKCPGVGHQRTDAEEPVALAVDRAQDVEVAVDAVRLPTSASSSPSITTLARNRRHAQGPIASTEMSEILVRPESWKVPSGPSHCTHSDVSSASKSAAISKRPCVAGAARLNSTGYPNQADNSSPAVAVEPSGSSIETASAPTRWARANSSAGSRRPVSARPVAVSTTAHWRSPVKPSSSTVVASSSSPCIDLTG
jgi:hypothetical protein